MNSRFGLSALLLIGCTVAGAAQDPRELNSHDLLAEYERLIPVNEALRQGKWIIPGEEFPKRLGRFDSRIVEETYYCGDLCPQNGTVSIRYAGVAEDECASIGDPLYLVAWGRTYQGCDPVIMREGAGRKDGSSWKIIYPRTKESTESIALWFDEQSECLKSGKSISCQEVRDGKHASVLAIKSGEDLVVLKLEM